jgi:hypothetical protein
MIISIFQRILVRSSNVEGKVNYNINRSSNYKLFPVSTSGSNLIHPTILIMQLIRLPVFQNHCFEFDQI